MRPLVGVTGPAAGGWFGRELTVRALRRAGATAVRLAPGSQVPPERLDALVLGGGSDVDPLLYGQPRRAGRPLDPARDTFELELLAHAERARLPLLAICRGLQLLNVARGGTLQPDVRALRGRGGHRRRLRASWPVEVVAPSRLAEIMPSTSFRVNRLHSQAIDDVGAGLVAVAHDSYGLIQALEDPARPFCLGVQWHPELLPTSLMQRSIWRALTEPLLAHR
ncbi:MAG: type 1 glutamine amidotransferase [Planctomycetota bacterium]